MLEFPSEAESRFPFKHITEAIIGAAFEVYNHLGYAVLVEIKIAPQYDQRDEAQLLNEPKATGLKIGLLTEQKSSLSGSPSESVFHLCKSVA